MGNLGKAVKLSVALFIYISCLFGENLDDFKAYVAKVQSGLKGWCSPEKAEGFVELIYDLNPDVCVEIGVFGGASFFPIAATLKFLQHGVAVAVDPWEKEECLKYLDPVRDSHHIHFWGNLDLDHFHGLFLELVNAHHLKDHVSILRTTSEKAAKILGKIDFLSLDGHHAEEAVLQDVHLYLPKVRSGGLICLNDSLWAEMQPAMEILLNECDPVRVFDGGNLVVLRKR